MSKTSVNPIWKVLFVLLIAYLSINLISQQQLIERKSAEFEAVLSDIAEQNELSQELLRERDMLMSDEFLEKTAREKLGMVKPGERVFVDLNRQE